MRQPLERRSPARRPTQLGRLMDLRGVLGVVVQTLGKRIVAGEWKPGEGLPTESEFMAELGVGRSVVREAVRILNAKGLVRSRPMDGTRVRPRAEWRLIDPDIIQWRIEAADRRALFDDLLRARLALEPGVAWAATASKDAAARARVDAAWRNKRAATEATDTPESQREKFIEADLEFHRALLAAAGSETLQQFFAVIEAALALSLDVQMQAKGSVTTLTGMNESNELHARVYEAFARGDAEGAQDAMRALVQSAMTDASEGLSRIG